MKYWSLFSFRKNTLEWVSNIKSNHFTAHPLNHLKSAQILYGDETNNQFLYNKSTILTTFQRLQKQIIVLNWVSTDPNPLCATDSVSS